MSKLPLLGVCAALCASVLPFATFGQEPTPTSTEAKKAPLAPASLFHVALSKASIGDEFLLSTAIIRQVVAPTGYSMAGKIVHFEVFPDSVDLYESTKGLVVTKELPARRLVTTFPILSQDETQVVIDFNAGMRRVFSDIWFGGSDGGNLLMQSQSLEVPQARVFEVRPLGEDLVIRQSAQVRDRAMDPNREDRVEIRYVFTPYRPGDFQSKEHGKDVTRHLRFFETYGQIEENTGRRSSRVTLFDIRQPVVIHYSANTPPEYESAVRAGILYWNRAFGKEVVRAEKAPEGVSAPDARYNLVQWVPWDSAGFAYADLIVDPRSGASKRGQAFMTSTFSFAGKARARALLRSIRSSQGGSKPAGPGTPPKQVLAGASFWNASEETPEAKDHTPLFPHARACACDAALFTEQLATGLESALSDRRFDDATALRVSSDYVCEVVAHEVGHMMGLRHNFAGSLSGTLSHKNLSEWFSAYLADDNTKLFADQLPTHSVMDYNNMKASAFVGWKIRTTSEVLPHDRAAIGWGYLGQSDAVEKKMLFGTDQDMMRYEDVVPFDYGADPVIGAYASLGEVVKLLPNSLLEQFIAAKAPRDPRDRQALAQLNLSPSQAANQVAMAYARLLSWFRSGARSLRVESGFDFVGQLNRRDVLRAHWKALNDQIEKLGGVDRALFAYLPLDLKLELKNEPAGVDAVEKIDAKRLTERLAKLLESADYTDFTGLDDKPAQFTKQEKELILSRGRLYFEEFQRLTTLAICQILARSPRDLGVQALEEVPEDDIVARLERRIVDVARDVLLARNEDVRHRGRVDRALVEVVDFRHDTETRMAAAQMLADGVGSFRSWCTEARSDLGKQLRESVDSALNVPLFKEFKDALLSRPLRDWYLTQQAVLSALGQRMPPAMPGQSRGGQPHPGQTGADASASSESPR